MVVILVFVSKRLFYGPSQVLGEGLWDCSFSGHKYDTRTAQDGLVFGTRMPAIGVPSRQDAGRLHVIEQ